MTEMDFLNALGKVDAKYIEECITYEKKSEKKPFIYNKWIKYGSMVAACFVLVVATVFVINHSRTEVPPVTVVEENGFRIENGVLVGYTGSETDITIPETVKEIADFSFLSNESAKQIEIVRLNSSVQKIENNAFAGLEQLKEIVVPEDSTGFISEGGLVMTSDETLLLHYERSTEEAFALPEKVTAVGAHAVQKTELVDIDFGDKLEYIGYGAFYENSNLQEINLPKTVKYIGEKAFSGCVSAISGSFSENAELKGEAFDAVPFYLTQQAGQMCPSEQVQRGLISPSEAIRLSNQDALYRQIAYILAYIKGENPKYDEITINAQSAVANCPDIPEDMSVPDTFELSKLTYTDMGWDEARYRVARMSLDIGDYTIFMDAYVRPYAYHTALYWKDVIFGIPSVYFVKNEMIEFDVERSESTCGWAAYFDKKDGIYCGITFVNSEGELRRSIDVASVTPYVLTFSPDGTRVAVEYTGVDNVQSFYVQALNGDKLWNAYRDYSMWYDADSKEPYKPGSLRWTDDSRRIEGSDRLGEFRWVITSKQVIFFSYNTLEGFELAKELLGMTYGELESKYGEMRLANYVNGAPLVSFKYLSGYTFEAHHVPYPETGAKSHTDMIDRSGYPDVVHMKLEDSVCGIKRGDKVSNFAEFIHEHNPKVSLTYNDGTCLQIEYEGHFILFRTSFDWMQHWEEHDDMEKYYLENLSGTISEIYVSSAPQYLSNGFGFAKEVLDMTYGELEEKYGKITCLGFENGGTPVLTLERLPDYTFIVHTGLPEDRTDIVMSHIDGTDPNYSWLDRSRYPDELRLSEVYSVAGLGCGKELSAYAYSIREREPEMEADHDNKGYYQIKYEGYYVCYMVNVDFGEYMLSGETYEQREQVYIENMKGRISGVRVSKSSLLPRDIINYKNGDQ